MFNLTGRHLRTLNALRTVDALGGVVKHQFGYNAAGNVISIMDIDSLVTTIERDGSGNPTAIVSPYGQRTTLTLNAQGYLSSITNPANETIQLKYLNGGLSDTLGGLLDTLIDARLNVHRFTYDSLGRVTKDENPGGGLRKLSRVQLTDGYDIVDSTAQGRVTTQSVRRIATGGIRITSTDASGLKTITTDSTDGSTITTTPDGTITTRTEGPDPRFGMQAPVIKNMTVKLPSGLQSTMSQGRLITQMTELQVTGMTDSVIVNGNVFRSLYDGTQKLIKAISAEGRQVFTFVDTKGRVVKDSIPGFIATTYKYDNKGRITETAQGGRKLTYTYDSRGRLATITDPLQHTTSFAYDSVGRVKKQTLPNLSEINYSYDSNGNLTNLSPPGRPAHTFNYTANDLTSKYTPPFAGDSARITSYTYNLNNELTRITRPESTFVDIEYGNAGCGCASLVGLPKTITFDRGQLSFRYNPTTGLLDTLIAPGADTLRYTYDGSLPKSVTWRGNVNGSVAVTYDNNFRVTKQIVNSADTVNFGYSNDGLLTNAGALSITRDSLNGRIKGTTLGNVTTNQTYNSKGELATYEAKYGSTTLFATTYTRDSLGRIAELDETVQGVTKAFIYAYDTTGRLINVWRNDTLISTYTYDDNGNRLSHIAGNDTTTATYDDQDRLLTYGNASYTHTKNGELRTKVVGIDTTKYAYDSFGNLTRVDLPNGDVVEYVIDGQNRRIAKRVNGATIKKWLYGDQLTPVTELDSANNIGARFGGVFMIKSGIAYRIIMDHLRNVRFVVNTGTGAIAQRIDYDEFGNVLVDTNPNFQPFGFAGGLNDSHTKLVRFGARDYDATVGRWTVKDPMGFLGGSDLYSYVSNNPINWTDPTGMYRKAMHRDRTIEIALSLGFSEKAAKAIGQAVYNADIGTQTENWEDTRIHAMSGVKPDGTYQSKEEAMKAMWDYVAERMKYASEALKRGDCQAYYMELGWGLHPLQDQYAWGHNFSEWHPDDWLDYPVHAHPESFSPRAIEDTVLFLRALMR